MVFTAGQMTLFFKNAAQMGIPYATVVQLIEEGIDKVQDLVEFDQDTLSTSCQQPLPPRRLYP
jgi:hypothetical protein